MYSGEVRQKPGGGGFIRCRDYPPRYEEIHYNWGRTWGLGSDFGGEEGLKGMDEKGKVVDNSACKRRRSKLQIADKGKGAGAGKKNKATRR